jgi:hypothetical protein
VNIVIHFKYTNKKSIDKFYHLSTGCVSLLYVVLFTITGYQADHELQIQKSQIQFLKN